MSAILFPTAEALAAEAGNFVAPILAQCRARPEQEAMVTPRAEGGPAERLTYGELGRDVAAWRAGLAAAGFGPGDRMALLFRPDRRLYALLLALLAAGMVPVFIDAGMGLFTILKALADAKPKAVATIPKLLRLRRLIPALKRCACYDAESGGGNGAPALETLYRPTDAAPTAIARQPDDHALITFTSGSTGRPKGADRSHGLLLAQHAALDAAWPLLPEDRPVTALPIFLLHGLACGVTTILADCDLAQPGQVDPARLTAQLQAERATMLAAAPAFALRVADHLAAQRLDLPALHTVFIGGAPSSPAMVARYAAGFGAEKVGIVYGSTEAEPIALTRATEILAAPQDAVLVGRPVAPTEAAVVALPEGPGPWREADVAAYRLPPTAIGEILVKGPHVLKRYVDNPAATAESKIPCADGEVWHRTGDRGYCDAEGRLWLTGRMRDVVEQGGATLEPFPWEMRLEAIPGVRRAALVGLGGGRRAEVVIEAEATADPAAIRAAAQALLPRDPWPAEALRVTAGLPMDRRHNSKIDRPQLRAELARRAVGPIAGRGWIVRLNPVDGLTLAGAGLAAGAVGLALAGHFAFALAVAALAMLADGLDGHLARRFNTLRPFGRELDGFVDVLDYLVFPALFLYRWGFDGPLDVAALLAMVGAGIIRLAVFNEIGNLPRPQGKPGYLGMPVFWTMFILWGAYLLALVIERRWVFWALDVVLLVSAAMMLRNALFFKFTKLAHLLLIPSLGAALFAGIGLYEAGAAAAWAVFDAVAAALVLTLPCVVGMSLHMFVVARDLAPSLRRPLHRGWFGANKTWRAFVVAPPLCALGAPLTLAAAAHLPPLAGLGPLTLTQCLGLGAAMAFAYLLFELPNSFLKRRLGVPAGGQAARGAWIFIIGDQLDSGIGIGLCAALVYGVPWSVAGLTILLFPFVALAVKRVLFALKWKSSRV